MFRSRAFRSNNHSSKITGRFARIDHARDFFVIERDFRNQNDIGATGNTALQRDPSRVPSHHFNDNDPPMAGRRSVQPIQRVHHNINGRIETERGCRRFEIVVDRFGTPMQLMPASCNCCAVTSEPSPPTTINALTEGLPRSFWRP